METPLTSLLEGAENYLVASMAVIPLVLIIIGVMLRNVPHIQPWSISLILWGIGVAVGIALEPAPEVKLNIVNGFVQGSIATGVAILYWRGLKGLLKEETESSTAEKNGEDDNL